MKGFPVRMLSKIIQREDLARTIKAVRASGETVVFTNGCFDILHVGHVRYLAAAKSEGDVLVVGLNSDESVKTIKKENRPIIPQEQRAEVLSSLWCVDYITLFDEPDPLSLIKVVQPDVLVKGADWPEEEIIGADFVKSNGGRVVRVSVVSGVSTSRIIQQIIKNRQLDKRNSAK
ncbi:D-glycero-beta-D-manno-heptose 1-phosphate adenylyltransferase [Thermodesulfobacteriota bacterium]